MDHNISFLVHSTQTKSCDTPDNEILKADRKPIKFCLKTDSLRHQNNSKIWPQYQILSYLNVSNIYPPYPQGLKNEGTMLIVNHLTLI